ncbi:MAG: DUF1273 domain-containing protein [Clostridia bacterium]|nr:DUF1273 domain-containing protein [Clostridia bacterium]
MLKLIKSKSVCFTGHRRQKLAWGFNESDERCLRMKDNLRVEIEKAINSGYETFYSGMALGFDLICVETILDLKKKYSDIKVVGVLPCKTQDCKWQSKDRERYRKSLWQLDGIRCIYDNYTGAECMLERNRFMVDNSSLMIVLYSGVAGGTKSTIEYARNKGLKITIIAP